MRTSIACISHGGECHMHAHSAHVHVTGAASLYLKARSIEVGNPSVVTFLWTLFYQTQVVECSCENSFNCQPLGKKVSKSIRRNAKINSVQQMESD